MLDFQQKAITFENYAKRLKIDIDTLAQNELSFNMLGGIGKIHEGVELTKQFLDFHLN